MLLRIPRRLLPTILTSLAAAMTVGAAGRKLTLEEAFSLAEQQNAAVLLDREAVIQSEAAYRRERAGLLPDVSLDAAQRRGRSVTVGSTGVVSASRTQRFDGNLNASVALLDPARIASTSVARTGVRVAELDLETTRQDALAAVANAYFAQQRNRARLEVIASNIERASVLLELAQRQLAAGVATQIDVTRSEAQLAVTQQARLQQETVLVQGELTLQRLLALPQSEPLTLDPVNLVRKSSNSTAAPAPGPMADPAPDVLARRADWRRTLEAVRQGELAVRAADYQRLPTIDLDGQYGLAARDAFDSDRKNQWLATASLSFPIFDGHRISANRQAARSLLRSLEIRQRDLKAQITAEQRAAEQDATSRLAQIVVAQKNRDLAAEQLRLARLRYGQGVADNREVVEAQSDLAEASDNWVEAVHRYHLSRVELARVHGDVRQVLTERE